MDNKSKEKFSIRKRLKSFKYAIDGLKTLLREEHNARIHLSVLLFVICAGFAFHISLSEWLAIIICAALVFAAETFNAALENICDKISLENDECIKRIKDLAAAAVLIAALASFICGIIIFAPKAVTLISGFLLLN